jgi:hypothetical protein
MKEFYEGLILFLTFFGLTLIIFFIRTGVETPYQILVTNVLFTMTTTMSILLFMTIIHNLVKLDLEDKFWKKWKKKNT